jgi:hypothetical protein
MNKNDVTFCTGFWYVVTGSGEPARHSFSHYINCMTNTFELLKDSNIIFFYEDENILNRVEKYVNSDNFEVRKIEISDLPTWEVSKFYLESCKRQDYEALKKINNIGEKGVRHYRDEYKKSGEISYRKIFTIWSSKIFLVDRLIEENIFGTNNFSWVDISYGRFKEKRDRWNFAELDFDDNHIYHYNSNMKYFGKKIDLNASFLFGHRNSWDKFILLYKTQIDQTRNSSYAHDEETIINLFYEDNINLFRNLGG